MKVIRLNKGKKVFVDDDDYKFLSQWKWRMNTGYAARRSQVEGCPSWIFMHRLIMGFPKSQVDHINGNRLDNRRSNLRVCTIAENHRNNKVKPYKLYKGISKTPHGTWRATITFKEKCYHLGTFDNPHIAALMYDFWATYLFGEFAYPNFDVLTSN